MSNSNFKISVEFIQKYRIRFSFLNLTINSKTNSNFLNTNSNFLNTNSNFLITNSNFLNTNSNFLNTNSNFSNLWTFYKGSSINDVTALGEGGGQKMFKIAWRHLWTAPKLTSFFQLLSEFILIKSTNGFNKFWEALFQFFD